MCKWIQIFLASIILLISCTQESGGGSQEGPNDNNQTKTELATLQDIVDNANAGETINLADYTDLTDYNAVINKSLTITNGSLNNAELTVTSENVKLDSLSDLSVKSSSKLTINDSKLNDLLLGTGEISRSVAVTSSAMAMASVTSCEIGNVKMLGFNSQLNITDKSTKITNIATSTKCKIVLEKGSYIDMKDPKVTGSGELVRIDMTKGMELNVLSIYQNPNKIEYNVGENFDKSGLIVMGTYFASVEIFKNDWKGEAKESVTKWEDEKDYEIVVPDLSTAGVEIVEITSNVNKNVKCYFHIFIKSDDSTAAAITISDVRVESGKKNYKVGEMLDLSGFRVIGNYGNFEINLPYTSKPADGTVLNEAGDIKVIFYYYIGNEEKTATAKISVTDEEEPTKPEQPTDETFTITFNANGGSGEMKAQTAKKGEKITLTANTFTKTGYTFSGWNTKSDGTGESYANTEEITLTADITLYAQWTMKVEEVTFLINETKQYNTATSISVDNGDKVTLSCETDGATIYYAEVTDIKSIASEFLSLRQKYSEPIAITENVTIAAVAVKDGMTSSELTYATFTVRTYTVTFVNNKGSAPEKISELKKGDKLGNKFPTPPTAEGYTFVGWYDGENNEFTAGTEITSNVTLTAEWEAISYNIAYELNGGTNAGENPESYDVETAVTLKDPKRDGYVFDGWYKEDSFTTKVTKIAKGLTGNITLYAKWTDFVFVKGATITEQITGSEIFTGSNVEINDFYMCNHEVTRGEYKDVIGCLPNNNMATTAGDPDNNPVNKVKWYDAIVYCNKRSKNEGLTPCYSIDNTTDTAKWGDIPINYKSENKSLWNDVICDFTANGYRLPTEAEWEYAACGGNGLEGTQYTYAGSDTISEVAWYNDNSDEKTHQVKIKKANGLRLYDMSGNVEEWCWDKNEAGDGRYYRGGSFNDGTSRSEIFCRKYKQGIDFSQTAAIPYGLDKFRGFRVVRTAEN